MANRYCYVCDAHVEGDVCPECGRPASEVEDQPIAGEETGAGSQANSWEQTARDQGISPRDSQGVPLADFEQPPNRELPTPPPIFLDDQDAGPTIGETLSRWIPERRWGGLAAVAAFALVMFAVVRFPSGLDEAQAPPVTEPQVDATRATLPDFVPDPREARPAVAPAGTWIGLVDPVSGNTTHLLGRDQDGDGPLTGLGDIRPDGTSLVVSATGQVRLVGGESVIELQLPLVTPQEAYGGKLALSPDGRRVAALGSDGTLAVWDQESGVGSLLVPPPADSLTWSPDSSLVGVTSTNGQGYTVWDVATTTLVSSSGDGSLLAVSSRGAAVWTGEQMVITDLEGNLLRSWPDFTINQERGLPPAEFDPNTKFLAISVASPGADRPLEGLWVLSVLGSRQDQLVPGQQPAKSFSWSGSGELLYYLDGRDLMAWPADPTFDVTTLDEESVLAPVLSHLRVYDHALVPSGGYFSPALEPTSISKDLVVGWPEAPSSDPDWEALQLHATSVVDDLCQVTERSSEHGAGPGPGGTPVAVIAGDINRTVVFETDAGLICMERPGSLDPSLFEGRSLTMLDDTILFTDGDSVRAISGFTSLVVVEAEDLGADRIMAIAGARDSLFVLVADGDRSIVHQIPVWSNTINLPFRIGESLDAPPFVVLVEQASDSGRILVASDAQTLAVELASTGVVQLLSYPDSQSTSPCEAGELGACTLFPIFGRAIDFSPTGDWLLVETSLGESAAVSTRLRGTVLLSLVAPLSGSWIGAG